MTVDRVISGWIDRGDLVAALDRATARRVTVISVPAGSGKTSLLRAWADRPGQPRRLAVMLIDDLHELSSPEAAAQLTRLLANLPPQVHALLATRHHLPLRLHQLRLTGELAEIRAVELRFSERETRALLVGIMAIPSQRLADRVGRDAIPLRVSLARTCSG